MKRTFIKPAPVLMQNVLSLNLQTHNILKPYKNQCCGSGSGRIRIRSDPDLFGRIRIRNFYFKPDPVPDPDPTCFFT